MLSATMTLIHGIIFLFFLKEGHACGTCVDLNSVPSTYAVKTYHESNEYIENPHRGFVSLITTKASQHSPLTKSVLDQYRQRDGLSTIQRLYYLDFFVTSPISSDYLTKISRDLDVIDSASFTVVLRFAYASEARPSHPYGDASKSIVLRHVGQLRPIFHQYERIITAIQAGFIGAWGEWHHTEYFGNPEWDTPGHDPLTGLMPQAFQDRKDVLMALLQAAPQSVQVQLRTPSQKIHLLGSTPATLQGVQRGTDTSRVGHHNDCFLASDDDAGTYLSKPTEYPYLRDDTRYTIMGGETCSLTQNHRHECPTATSELAMFHWTYLNEAYNQDVYNVWKQQGCYDDVHRRLGYRLTIDKAILPKTIPVGEQLCFALEFRNQGYAAPVKNLKLLFILQSTSSSSRYYAAQVPDVDVRDWQPSRTHTVASAVHLTNVPEGEYKVLLSLSDPLMADRADYNVLLATSGVPLYRQGLNDLGQVITVSGQHTQSTTCPALSPWQPPAMGHYSRLFQGSF